MTRRLSGLMLFVVIAGLLPQAHFVKATTADTWAYTDWQFRTKVTVSNQEDRDLTDFQVKIVLNSSWPGWDNVNEDGSDIRFADQDGNQLKYYIESWDYEDKSATIWVKIPRIPASGSVSIYVYYGNAAAVSESSGAAVFDFFDDFETWNGWVNYGSGVVSQSAEVALDGKYSAKKDKNGDPHGAYKPLGFTLDYSFVLEAYIDRINFSGANSDRIGVINDNGDGYGVIVTMSQPNIGIDKRDSYSATANSRVLLSSSVTNDWYFVRFIFDDGNMKAEVYYNGTLLGSTTYTDDTYSIFTRVYIFGGYPYYVDDLRIRKYASKEPITAVSTVEEQQATTATVTVLFRDDEGNTLDNVELYVDDNIIGVFNGSATLNVTVGTHTFKAVRVYYSPAQATIDIHQNTTIVLTLTRIGFDAHDLRLDGQNDYVKGFVGNLSSFSVIVVARIEDKNWGALTGKSQDIIRKGSAGNDWWFRIQSYPPYDIEARIYTTNGTNVAGTSRIIPVQDGETVFLAMTFVEGRWKIFKNDKLLYSVTTPYPNLYSVPTAPIFIGGVGTTENFKGTVFFVFIYNRALSDREIRLIYHDPFHPPTSGLVLWYAPDSIDTLNNVWLDKSGNGNDGSIVGATYVPLGKISEFLEAYCLYFNDSYIVAQIKTEVLTQFTIVTIVQFDEKILTGNWRQDNDDLFSAYENGGLRLDFLYEKRQNIYLTIRDSNLNYYFVKTHYDLDTNTTYMLVATFDNGLVDFYVNAQQVYSTTINARNISFNTIYLGRRITGDQPFRGKYYTVYFYVRKLNSSEIRLIYHDPFHPPTSGLVLWYGPYTYDPVSGKWLNRAPIFPTVPLAEELDGVNYGATAERVSIPRVEAYDATNNSEISVYNLTVKTTDGEKFIPWFMPLPYNQTLTLNVSAVGYRSSIVGVQTPIDNLVFYLYPSQVITSWERPELNVNLNNITADEYLPDASKDIDKFSSLFTRWLGGEYFKWLFSLDLDGMLKDFFNNPPIPGLGILVALMIWAAAVLMTWIYFEEPEPVFVEGNIVYFGLMQFIDVSPGILAVPLGVFVLFLGYKQLYKALKVWAKR